MIATISAWLFFKGLDAKNAKRGAWLILCGAIIVLLVVVIVAGRSCYTNSQIDATGKQIDGIRQEQSDATVQKDVVTIEAKEKQIETAKQQQARAEAMRALEEARKKDSVVEPVDAWAAIKRYCSNYPTDSICAKQ